MRGWGERESRDGETERVGTGGPNFAISEHAPTSSRHHAHDPYRPVSLSVCPVPSPQYSSLPSPRPITQPAPRSHGPRGPFNVTCAGPGSVRNSLCEKPCPYAFSALLPMHLPNREGSASLLNCAEERRVREGREEDEGERT